MPGAAGPGPAAPAAGPAGFSGTLGGATPYTAGFSAEAIPGGASVAAATAEVGGASAASTDAAGAGGPGGTTGAENSGAAGVGGAADSFAGPGSASGGAGGSAGATIPPASNGTADALSLPRAGFWIRMLALLIDSVIVGVVFNVLDHHTRLQLLALAAYGAIMWKLKGTTVGGIVCNLKIVRVDGREIDWSTAIVRALGCFLSLVVCGLGFIWIAFDPGRQAWHDKIAGTAVVRVPQGVSLL